MTTVDLLFAAVVILACVAFASLLMMDRYRRALTALEWFVDVGPDMVSEEVYSCPACGSLMRDGVHAAGCPIADALDRDMEC